MEKIVLSRKEKKSMKKKWKEDQVKEAKEEKVRKKKEELAFDLSPQEIEKRQAEIKALAEAYSAETSLASRIRKFIGAIILLVLVFLVVGLFLNIFLGLMLMSNPWAVD